MTQTDQSETRQDVCRDCEYQVLSVPIACELVTTTRLGQSRPCSGILRQMMQTATATCPHPNPEWAARWNDAELLPVPSTIVGNVTTPAAKNADAAVAGDATGPQDKAGQAVNGAAKSGMTRCQLASANRQINPAEIEQRAQQRVARRGNSNRVFHVHRIEKRDPARAVPNP